MFGSMMFIIAANFISSCPMMALKGYTGRAAAFEVASVSASLAEIQPKKERERPAQISWLCD
jgi:hypothetical protein